jgi:hypothetical protein
LRGIDIFHRQGAIDWDAIAPQLDFVFIKATQGPGPSDPKTTTLNKKSIIDSHFGDYRESARAHHLIRGYYHFAIPNYMPFHEACSKAPPGTNVTVDDYESDAEAQANFFCDAVGTLGAGELDLVLDLEATKYGHGHHALTDGELRRHGAEPFSRPLRYYLLLRKVPAYVRGLGKCSVPGRPQELSSLDRKSSPGGVSCATGRHDDLGRLGDHG